MYPQSFFMNRALSLWTLIGTLIGMLWAPSASWGQEPTGARSTETRLFPDVDRFGDPLPAGALARLGTERFRHWYPGYVVYSPDGKTLASITHLRYPEFAEWQYAALWDAATGKKLLHIPDVQKLAFAPDSKSAAVHREGDPIRVLQVARK
ncbi:MAG: hypothetical protein L0215_08905 [Gemmataceae bacterium]|nr:hypothetical protein [Gemmataceae bacterium]